MSSGSDDDALDDADQQPLAESGTHAAGHARIQAAVAAQLGDALSRRPEPGLHLVATPIGNLADTSFRAVAVLAGAHRVYCEDTRQTLKLLNRFGIARRLGTYHEHNAEARRPEILSALERGETVALVSDAGTPLISDPGYKLARSALDAGHRVTAVPGPSAALAALTTSGLPSDTFLFAGFLPPRSGQRRTRLTELAGIPATLLLFETANRLAETLADIAAVLGDRETVVARELTKLHEEVRRGTASALAAELHDLDLKGECVIVIAPPGRSEATDAALTQALRTALSDHTLRDAVRDVAERFDSPRNRVYALAVALRETAPTSDDEAP